MHLKKRIPYQSLKQTKLNFYLATVFQTEKTNCLSLLTFCVCRVDNFFPAFPFFGNIFLIIISCSFSLLFLKRNHFIWSYHNCSKSNSFFSFFYCHSMASGFSKNNFLISLQTYIYLFLTEYYLLKASLISLEKSLECFRRWALSESAYHNNERFIRIKHFIYLNLNCKKHHL